MTGSGTFEVDDIDVAGRRGWSVLLTGPMNAITGDADLTRAAELGISPWAPGVRNDYVRITARDVSGRRVVSVGG